MLWLTWRQHRRQALFAVMGLAALAALLLPTGHQMRRTFVDSGLAACLDTMDRAEFVADGAPSCESAGLFADRYATFGLLAGLFTVVPLIVGLFFGAPIVARKIEHGTHRLVWTQGVTRLRWVLVKVGAVGVFGVVLAVAYALLVSWWVGPFAQASASRFDYMMFDVVGVAPIGYTLFALAAGIAAGTVWRRVVPAMAATLVVFVAVRVAVAAARPRFMPPEERRFPIVTDTQPNRLLGDWLLDYGLYGPDGHKIRRVYRVSCAPTARTRAASTFPAATTVHIDQAGRQHRGGHSAEFASVGGVAPFDGRVQPGGRCQLKRIRTGGDRIAPMRLMVTPTVDW